MTAKSDGPLNYFMDFSCYLLPLALMSSTCAQRKAPIPAVKSLSLLAVSSSLVALTFEALQLQPRGVNICMVFHGFYCLLIGYLIFRSTFLPRILGTMMAFAGLVWLIYLSPPLANYLSPYNTASSGKGRRCCGSS